jgi:Zinc-uptake complex component A periplasmic
MSEVATLTWLGFRDAASFWEDLMKHVIVMSIGCLLAIFLPAPAEAKKLTVVTATTDMAALAQEVGGDRISVESIAKGYQDPHFVEAKPSFLLKLRQADLLIVVGLQLEIGWLPPLITQSGNGRVQVGPTATWTRRSSRKFSTSPRGPSLAPWVTFIPSAIRIIGLIPTMAAA